MCYPGLVIYNTSNIADIQHESGFSQAVGQLNADFRKKSLRVVAYTDQIAISHIDSLFDAVHTRRYELPSQATQSVSNLVAWLTEKTNKYQKRFKH